MKGFTKKIGALVLSLTLVIGMATSASAATWDSYFGQNAGWYEGALGSMSAASATGFTAKMDQIGWGGVWGAQVFQKISVTKGKAYALSFDVKSTQCNKFIYVKLSTGEKLAKAFWVKLAKGKTTKVNIAFKAANAANQITFGVGGDFGDRIGSEVDAQTRYNIFKKQFKKSWTILNTQEAYGDSAQATSVIVSKYSLKAAPKKVSFSAKAKGGKKVKVSIKKAAGIKTYEVQVGAAKKKTTGTSVTVKAKKTGKLPVKVRGISEDKSYKTGWATKKVKVK